MKRGARFLEAREVVFPLLRHWKHLNVEKSEQRPESRGHLLHLIVDTENYGRQLIVRRDIAWQCLLLVVTFPGSWIFDLR